MRSREFIMKDAYSFHANEESLEQTYEVMHATYCAIFNRLGLEFRAVVADSGNIGGILHTSSTSWPTQVRTKLRLATAATTPQI